MPFCTQCGNQVGPADRFCGRCGSGQAQTAAGGGTAAAAAGIPQQPGWPYAGGRDPFSRIQAVNSRTASLLCYVPVIGWIMSIVVLASAKYRDDYETRFHAFQGLYLFVAWLIVEWVVGPVMSVPSHFFFGFRIEPLLKLLLIGAWIFMLIKVSHRERFKLPIIGDLAEKSVSEQRV
jgi:uncharacterized membrane protein